MTRVVAGVAGGRRLTVPRGRATRPTSERTREGLFSTLAAMHGSLTGMSFLDLYAGSGAVGLEAASRGAATVLLVETDASALTAIRANVAALGLQGVDVRAASVARMLDSPAPARFDVAFLDPPYSHDVDADLSLLVGNEWVADGGTVVVERATRSSDLVWPAGIEPDRCRRYGDSTLWYGRRS